MFSLEDALAKVLDGVRPIDGAVSVEISEAVGRFAASDVLAPIPLPLFDNSAMDGWAVRSADVQRASCEMPVTLENVANIPAGGFFDGEIGAGQCARIFTGSPLPRGADAVVMQEDARVELPQVQILDVVKPWENVRFRGEDVKERETILRTGDRINAQNASLISACGVAAVAVKPVVKVAILATGNELRRPGESVEPGQIFESNRILISALARRLGYEPLERPIVSDGLAATVDALRKASRADAIVTCGGVSVGEYDFVKAAILNLGGNIDFWRVAIKPGKPFAHARVLGKPLFALPGNPVSALVTFWLLVRPALLKMAGAAELSAPVCMARLAEEISNPGDRRHFVRVRVDAEGSARLSGPQASHRLASLTAANGLVDVPANAAWEAGRIVTVIRLD